MSRKAPESYFWSKIERRGPDECWNWMGYCDRNKYGRYGHKLAHRLAFQFVNGPIEPGNVVCHSCDNPKCCNPSHLWQGTQLQNCRDMDAKNRRVLPPVRRGTASNTAKLTPEQAKAIFNSRLRVGQLAEKFGVSSTAIRHIKNGTNWAHVTGARHAP